MVGTLNPSHLGLIPGFSDGPANPSGNDFWVQRQKQALNIGQLINHKRNMYKEAHKIHSMLIKWDSLSHREWRETTKISEMNTSPRILYPARLLFRLKERYSTPGQEPLSEFTALKPALQETVTGFLKGQDKLLSMWHWGWHSVKVLAAAVCSMKKGGYSELAGGSGLYIFNNELICHLYWMFYLAVFDICRYLLIIINADI